jgi:D-alanyl-D-alanine carboxypeptidase/D-alanyl-D-alanine-endopeptidase (penicillin-binding protein 4)
VAAVAAAVAVELTVGLPWDVGFSSTTPSTSATATPTPPAPTWAGADAVLALGVAAPAAEAPTVEDVLGDALGASALGDQVGISVVDLTTYTPVFSSGTDDGHVPASTLKLITTAAALQVLGPGHTFTTRVVSAGVPSGEAGPGDAPEIVLVGGGDPTLTSGDSTDGTPLSSLADATAAALEKSGVSTVRLRFDDGLFTGPAVDPDWRSTYVSSGVVSPVSALAVDGGRVRPDSQSRSDDPAQAAADDFAAMLDERGITVEGEPARAAAPATGTDIAGIESPQLASIVEHVLEVSDNDGAEVLARHVALGRGLPGTSADAETAIVEALGEVGIDLSGASVLDGSGLARGSQISASAFTSTLTAAADPAKPHLRAVLTGLPVAGFTGTLDERYDGESGVGVIRAKTGTLTGVSSLAGVVTSTDGTLYAFAILADDVGDTGAARDALDDVARALSTCGCAA